jgi:hypothetical protein
VPKKKLKKSKKNVDRGTNGFYILQNVKYNFNSPNDLGVWVAGNLMLKFGELC